MKPGGGLAYPLFEEMNRQANYAVPGRLDLRGGDGGSEFIEEVGGLLRVRCGGEDRAAVVLQDYQFA